MYFCSMDERSLKNTIRRIREDLGLTQEEFAQELGMDASTYWRLEEGRTHIISENFYRIVRYAGLTMEEALVGKDAARVLREAEDYPGKLDAMREFYEKQLAEKDTTIRNLNKYIGTLQK